MDGTKDKALVIIGQMNEESEERMPLILLSTTLARLKMTLNQSKSSFISQQAGRSTLTLHLK